MKRARPGIAIAVGACALVTSCGAPDTAPINPVASVREADPCSLLTADEVATMTGRSGMTPVADKTFDRISDCEWGTDAGSAKVRLVASSPVPGMPEDLEGSEYDHEVRGNPALVIADDWGLCLYEVSFSDRRVLQLTAMPTEELQRAKPTTFGDTTCDRTLPTLEKVIERLAWN